MTWTESIQRVRVAFEELQLAIGNHVKPFCDRSELWLRDHMWFHVVLDALAIVVLGALFLLAIVTIVY